jgi:hypothetical protein
MFAAQALLASCAGSSHSPGAPAQVPSPMPAVDAGSSAFGNSMMTGMAGMAASNLMLTYIDDGGIALLPDGAMIYVLFRARPCPPSNMLSYENFGAAFFASYCLRCHSAQKTGADRNDAPVGLNFDDLAFIQSMTEHIWGQAGDSNTTMPAGAPKPTPDERAKLGAWLACGAPGNGTAGDAGTKP